MSKQFPWYDANWLRDYVSAKQYVAQHYPQRLSEFIDAFDPLRTHPGFETTLLPDLFDNDTLHQARQLISDLTQDYSKLSDDEIKRVVSLLYNQRARPAPEGGLLD